MEAHGEPLLLQQQQEKKKVVYYGDCPGCRQDQKNEANAGIPYKEFIYIWVVALCSSLPISSLFPFLYFMVRDLHIAKTEEDIGFYAGFVGSSFMFGRALTSIFWGIVADKYGRKPVIVISIVSVTSFWMAITTRSLLGFFSGLLGPLKAYASEVCRKEHQALGLSLVSTSRGIGLIIGPAIGGYLSQPAEKFPDIFSTESIFGRFPYFLPCLCISLFAVCALASCFWLPPRIRVSFKRSKETLHNHSKQKLGDRAVEALEAAADGSDIDDLNDKTDERSFTSNQSLLHNWPLISTIIVYCVFSLHDTAYSEIFSLWAESDKRFGGLSFSSQDVGQVLAISGFSLLLYQLFFYPSIEKALGPLTSSRVAAVCILPLFCFCISFGCLDSLRNRKL